MKNKKGADYIMARLPANCRKKANGKLELRGTYKGVRYSVTGSSTKELRERELERRKQIDDSQYKNNSEITVNEYYPEWVENRKAYIKESTLGVHDNCFQKHILPALGKYKLCEIEKRQIQDFQKSLVKKDLKPSTVNLIMAKVRTLLNDAVKDEIIERSPAEHVRRVSEANQTKAAETIHRALTEDEQKAFFEAAADEWLYEFFLFSVCTGMRCEEITCLKWSDVDYSKNVVHVTRTFYCVKKKWLEQPPKTKCSIRDIPLTANTKRALAGQREKMFSVYGSEGVKPDSRIFLSVNGRFLTLSMVNPVIDRILRKIEKEKKKHIDHFSSHAFRDTFATNYIRAGGTLQTLKTILGHSSLSMTADLYAHVLPDTKQAEMDQMAAAFNL